ncbi:glycogen debranching protein [Flagellimonas aequoris]|uniref:Glycogen debranching protein n=2 Tax=Flagellimonas aequoris TaxID=2306997 RepID=A0A418N7U5_9FLAO|nr:glycogen debranching protein [Allomuricauda aequoris]TXK02335.1 glycogen debranching protein [Allomuricauda aequoris]
MQGTPLRPILLLTSIFLIAACSKQTVQPISRLLQDSDSIQGKLSYLESPFVTAGDRIYMVGHQDGSFPPLGWHIKGEMGGIWDHPIKLMDGFDAEMIINGHVMPFNKASEFVNYPFANKHRFEFDEEDISVERIQFVPDGKQGVFVQYVIHNNSKETKTGKFQFNGQTDLRPTWLGERTNMIDGKDEATFDGKKWVVKDVSNPWFSIFGSEQTPDLTLTHENPNAANGVSNTLIYEIELPAESNFILNFTIAGSYTSLEDAKKNYTSIQNNFYSLAQEKKERYSELASKTKLTIPDKDLEQAFTWLKYNCDWLVRTIPEIGTGIGAGLPDYPWWFGVDSEYALKGYMAIGREDIVEKTIQLLDSVSMVLNGNGRILHEMSTNGAVFNEGNINETPQFASLIWEIYSWNGDKEFLKRYFPTVQKGLDWLLAENDGNQNLFPDGFGMMEIHGLNSEMIDVASYTQKAFADAAQMASELEQPELAKKYQALADTLKQKINDEFWSDPFGSYADFIGTDEQAIHLIENAIIRADTLNKPWAVKELQATKQQILDHPSNQPRPFVLYHNWVVNTPMEMGIADSSKAFTALDNAKKFTNPFGMFVTGIDRDESAGKDMGSFKGSKVFSYTGAVMTLPTGVQAVAENNYGRPDEALDYLKRMTRTFSYAIPGSIYEVSPDYGMVTQAWNIYAFAFPIVRQFFGIQPMAQHKTVKIKPQMPSSWGHASLENVKIGDNEISIWYENKDGNLQMKVEQTNPNWSVIVELPQDDYQIVQGEAQITSSGNRTIFTGKGTSLEISKKQ